MALVLMALATAAAFAREGIVRTMRPLLPHVQRLSGVLLTAAGAYLIYYWWRIRFGNDLTLADDPVVGFASRYSGHLEAFAQRHGLPLIIGAAGVVVLALFTRVRRDAKNRESVPTEAIRP